MVTGKPRILVVDDHSDSRVIVVLAMETWGYEAVEARDGREAMAQLEGGNFNLVIVDLAMPFMNGVDVGRSIRSDPRTKNIPILALTALDTSHSRTRCFEAGFNDFLAKPFPMAELKSKVETLLSRASRQ